MLLMMVWKRRSPVAAPRLVYPASKALRVVTGAVVRVPTSDHVPEEM